MSGLSLLGLAAFDASTVGGFLGAGAESAGVKGEELCAVVLCVVLDLESNERLHLPFLQPRDDFGCISHN